MLHSQFLGVYTRFFKTYNLHLYNEYILHYFIEYIQNFEGLYTGFYWKDIRIFFRTRTE